MPLTMPFSQENFLGSSTPVQHTFIPWPSIDRGHISDSVLWPLAKLLILSTFTCQTILVHSGLGHLRDLTKLVVAED